MSSLTLDMAPQLKTALSQNIGKIKRFQFNFHKFIHNHANTHTKYHLVLFRYIKAQNKCKNISNKIKNMLKKKKCY
jgi:hypothetical protein